MHCVFARNYHGYRSNVTPILWASRGLVDTCSKQRKSDFLCVSVDLINSGHSTRLIHNICIQERTKL